MSSVCKSPAGAACWPAGPPKGVNSSPALSPKPIPKPIPASSKYPVPVWHSLETAYVPTCSAAPMAADVRSAPPENCIPANSKVSAPHTPSVATVHEAINAVPATLMAPWTIPRQWLCALCRVGGYTGFDRYASDFALSAGLELAAGPALRQGSRAGQANGWWARMHRPQARRMCPRATDVPRSGHRRARNNAESILRLVVCEQ